jgi:putative phosphoesterase
MATSDVRLAFLSDIHGNLPALRAALVLADHAGAARIVCAGDVVGGGPYPEEVVRALRSRGVPTIAGNVDRKVVRLARSGKDLAELALASGKRRNRANQAWTAFHLSRGAVAWLAKLPAEIEETIRGRRILVVHGSPLGDEDYLFPSVTAAGLRAKLGDRRPDVLVCGHSHVPFVRRVAGVLVVNCGSVGRPVDGDPRPTLALVDVAAGGVHARIVRFAYPVGEIEEAVVERDVPGATAAQYRLGIKQKSG